MLTLYQTNWLLIAKKRGLIQNTTRRWHTWLYDMREKDEVEILKMVSRMINSAEGGTGLLHSITKPTVWRGGVQMLMEEEEDAKPLEKRTWHWHCDEGARLERQSVEK